MSIKIKKVPKEKKGSSQTSYTKRMKSIKEARKKSKIPRSVKEAEEAGWKRGPYAMMSNPPIYTYSKGKRTYRVRGEMSKAQMEYFKKLGKRPKKTKTE